ncbi:helix-turn-helix domain-containing protein [Ottowia sp.]|uniref:helix-turn-helix domain-containing protein n=1 Tax=Ottowia sp. TaxID=1898956 RepID=UPI0039E608FA
MPSPAPPVSEQAAARLQALGGQVRARRKALRLSATVTAQAAGLSRVTLHRIEKGEPSVTMGAWCNAMAALGLHPAIASPADDAATHAAQAPTYPTGWIPARVALADYPQLRALAWQVHGIDALTPAEALDIYERNARHLDQQAMPTHEQALLQALRQAFSHGAAGSSSSGSGSGSGSHV